MKLNIPKNVKKIGLAMSGGCDSSLLLYLLCNQIVEDNLLDVTIHPLIFCHIDRPSMIKPVYDVIMEVERSSGSLFPIERPHVGYAKHKTTEILKEYLNPKERNVDIICRGTTRNPPLVVMPGDQKDRAWEDPEEPEINEEGEWVPFTNMHKQDLALIYKELNLKNIFELTVSCIGHFDESEGFTKACRRCWWCFEKNWAFKTFGNEWLI